jgi:hypothetical protein
MTFELLQEPPKTFKGVCELSKTFQNFQNHPRSYKNLPDHWGPLITSMNLQKRQIIFQNLPEPSRIKQILLEASRTPPTSQNLQESPWPSCSLHECSKTP